MGDAFRDAAGKPGAIGAALNDRRGVVVEVGGRIEAGLKMAAKVGGRSTGVDYWRRFAAKSDGAVHALFKVRREVCGAGAGSNSCHGLRSVELGAAVDAVFSVAVEAGVLAAGVDDLRLGGTLVLLAIASPFVALGAAISSTPL